MSLSKDPDLYAEGGNYRVTLDMGGVAHVRVWRRPDVSREVGASYAEEKIVIFGRLTAEPWPRVRGVIMDLAEAPTSWGPMTELALGRMFATVEAAKRWLAVVTAADALQMMMAGSLVKKTAPLCGRTFGSFANAYNWAGQRKRISQ